jgi:FkbM family methyltransferase
MNATFRRDNVMVTAALQSNATALRVDFVGKHFWLDDAAGMDLVARTIAAGGYETPLPIMIAAMVLRLPGMFLDVGANNGVYSVIAASVKPDIQIVAFEPVPQIADLLRRNIALNGLEGQVKVVEVALSDTDGEAPIFLPDPGHGLIETSASLLKGFNAGATPSMTVQTKTLDSFILHDGVSVAKVDIEGYELEFIRGAEATIRRDRPVIFAEMLSVVEHKFAEISKRMSDMGYLFFRLRPDVAILAQPIKFDQLAWNYCLLPQEKINLFREVCAIHGLEILAPS